MHDARDELQQLLVGYVKAVGTHQVKRNEAVVLVQIVDRERGIDLRHAALDPAAQVVGVGGDGVAVQCDADAHLALDVVLDGVQDLVVLKRVALAGHLHVRAGKLPTGAIVVHHQVVRA